MITRPKPSFEQNIANATEVSAYSSGRILLVDDDLYIRELYSEALIICGYNVDTLTDGAPALQALQDYSYDLLITDNKMPKVTGLELIQKLRSAGIKLPIILMSGTLPTKELKLSPWLQPDATLAKPLTVADLLDTVKNVLRAVNDATKNPQVHAISNKKISTAKKPVSRSVGDEIRPSFSILVVDDDDAIRQLSMNVLTDSGYDVKGVKDGAAGWEELQTNDYDLVVTDNKMPKMSGIEMIEKLRSTRMAIPVIMATGILPTHEFARKPWLKPDAILQRPFSNDDLLATVKQVLRSDDGNDGYQETLLSKYL